ncbi:MAG: HNH endonuclease [Candidatus Melainabacteria bacterium RIFOXYA12_FULL_32_12]|nr:MAG: HNH endonuclease [Candidatus Melainabacteria bacterium RIFOXYA2_FULL_32_9]OGI31882.1 MAG: HNH endonuclease [Candidatus Melainabacteria bacterium RIFOXYA12_FULL_32_12]
MNKVLLLNASYEPLNLCSWRRALVLLLKGKAEKVEAYESLISENIYVPSVIRLRYYVVVPYKELPFNRKNIMHRDNYTCQYCGKVSSSLTIDHIIPKSKGGKSTWENVVAACARCNSLKADKTLEESGLRLRKNPGRPKNYIRFELTKQSKELFNKWEKYIAS